MPAPITSYGYAGSVAPNIVWARMQYTLGNRYFVLDTASLAVTAVGGTSRQVKISKGSFGGWGILDELTQDFTFTLPDVTGDSWFMIVARRTWGTAQATDFAAINAGSGASLPPRSTNPGILDDQPVALVQVRADRSIGTIRDLRAIGGHGNFIAFDDLVRTYLLVPGATMKIGADSYKCGVQGGTPTWTRDFSPLYKETATLRTNQGSEVIALESGWIVGEMAVYGTRFSNLIDVSVEISRTGPTIEFDTNGGLADLRIGTLQSAFRPYSTRVIAGSYIGGDSSGDRGSFGCTLTINSIGGVYLHSGARNMNLNKRTDGGRSLSFSDTFIQR